VPDVSNTGDLLARRARQRGQRPALVYGDRVYSYADLDRRANQAAHVLRGADKLGAGTRRVYDAIRTVSDFVEQDRDLERDIQRFVGLIRSGELATIVEGVRQ
jgi:non-ribosomal peptide synthetase component F